MLLTQLLKAKLTVWHDGDKNGPLVLALKLQSHYSQASVNLGK